MSPLSLRYDLDQLDSMNATYIRDGLRVEVPRDDAYVNGRIPTSVWVRLAEEAPDA